MQKMLGRRIIIILVFISVNVVHCLPSSDVQEKNVTNFAFNNCSRPPMGRGIRECCTISKQNLWGDFETSFQECRNKFMTNSQPIELKPTNDPVIPTTTLKMTKSTAKNDSDTAEAPDSEGKEFNFKSYFNDQNRRRWKSEKQCFFECVFQKEGLIKNDKLNEEAIVEKIKSNMKDDEEWRTVAIAAAKKCMETDFGTLSNSSCKSGAAEMFKCVFKESFLNCPTWPKNNELCNSVKEYYQRCPHGSPPLQGTIMIVSRIDNTSSTTVRP